MNVFKALFLLTLLCATALAVDECDVTIAEATASDSQVVPENDKNNEPENALDGDFGTYWTSDEDGATLYLHLEEPATVTGVELAFWKGDEREQSFSASINGIEVLRTTSSSGDTDDYQFFALDDQTQETDIVELHFYGNTDNDWNSITEARVCGTEVDDIKVTTDPEVDETTDPVTTDPPEVDYDSSECDAEIASATATDSEVDEDAGKNNIPENALDGDFGTYWTSDKDGAILYLHLAEASVVTGMDLAFWDGMQRQQSFSVSVVDGKGSSVEVLGTTSSSGDTDEFQLFEFEDQTQETSTVEVHCYGNSENDWNSITEARVCGTVVDDIEVTTDPLVDETTDPMTTDPPEVDDDSAECDAEIASATATDSEVDEDEGKNNVPENALDRDFDTYWTSDEDGAILYLHLAQASVVTGVELAFWKGDEREQSFSVSINGVQVLGTMSSSGDTNDYQFFALDDQTQETDLVELHFYGNSDNDWNSITEARVCGSAAVTDDACENLWHQTPSTEYDTISNAVDDDPAWELCAQEGGVCECDGLVIYGEETPYHGIFTFPVEVSGSIDCDNAHFGDPMDCCGKACHCLPDASLASIDPEAYYWAFPAGGEECQAGDGNCPIAEQFSCAGALVVGSAATGVFLGPVDVDIDAVACLAEDIDALSVFGTEDCEEPLQSEAFPDFKPTCLCQGVSAALGA